MVRARRYRALRVPSARVILSGGNSFPLRTDTRRIVSGNLSSLGTARPVVVSLWDNDGQVAVGQLLRDGRSVFGDRSIAIYEVLEHLPTGLLLDIGAAVGMTTKLMLDHSPRSNVIAFEPFPGNHEHFLRRYGNDSRVILHRKAVSNTNEDQWFYVSDTVQPGTIGWGGFEGSSSLGFVIKANDRRVDKGFRVASCRLDDVIEDGEVIFTKIDIQGGEAEALRGAASALHDHRLKVLFVEFGGDLEVLQLMLDWGYEFFDHEYFLIPRLDVDPDLRQWEIHSEGTLSTGAKFYRGWPISVPEKPEDYCEFFRAESGKIGSVWTDLVFVAPQFMPTFVQALRAYNQLPALRMPDDLGSERQGEGAGGSRLMQWARRLVAQIPGVQRIVRRLRRWRDGRH